MITDPEKLAETRVGPFPQADFIAPTWNQSDEFLFVNGYGKIQTATREQIESIWPKLPR